VQKSPKDYDRKRLKQNTRKEIDDEWYPEAPVADVAPGSDGVLLSILFDITYLL
jgi:hypothetical protein